jgi:hypothetical protein
MNKKLIALALVLLIAVGGVFANEFPTDEDTVLVTLKGSIGPVFYHGIVESGSYLSSKEVTGAFGATAPSFTYGYETNEYGPYYLRMTVGDFEQTGVASGTTPGVVKIKEVTSNSAGTMQRTGSTYTVFTVPSGNSYSKESALITIYPMKTAGEDHVGDTIGADETIANAPTGQYVATVTFSVSGS